VTRLAVVGPYLQSNYRYSDYPGQAHDLIRRTIIFRRSNVDSLVAEVYLVADDVARRLGVEVSFPEASPDSDPRTLWIDAVDRLARADAVLAVSDGEGHAIPLEAALARQMDCPLLVAVTDSGSVAMFEQAAFPVIDARLGLNAVEQAIMRLLGESPSGAGFGRGGGLPLLPPDPTPVSPSVPLQ
jgi:hypothetical protein